MKWVYFNHISFPLYFCSSCLHPWYNPPSDLCTSKWNIPNDILRRQSWASPSAWQSYYWGRWHFIMSLFLFKLKGNWADLNKIFIKYMLFVYTKNICQIAQENRAVEESFCSRWTNWSIGLPHPHSHPSPRACENSSFCPVSCLVPFQLPHWAKHYFIS